MTLQIELIWLPNFFASNNASRVSLVSPDCEMAIVRVLEEQTDFAGNSLAINASERTSVRSRIYDEIISDA